MKHELNFMPEINGLSGYRPLTLSEFARLKAADKRATAHLHPKQADHLKAKRQARWPVPCVDEDGKDCYLVPLNDRRDVHALVEMADYWSARDSGADGLWYPNRSNGFTYVQTDAPLQDRKPGGKITVSRLVLNLPGGKRVSVRNGNGLDLRRKNLVAVSGNGRRSPANVLSRALHEREAATQAGWKARQGLPA
ncbi:hypothetical protein KUV28_15045 [Ferrimonas balearica]|nr:hypothetical protein [Ferrimonas balearica]